MFGLYHGGASHGGWLFIVLVVALFVGRRLMFSRLGGRGRGRGRRRGPWNGPGPGDGF